MENFLLDRVGMLKLCDFGSATTEKYHPDDTWSANKRSVVEDEVGRHFVYDCRVVYSTATQIYRARFPPLEFEKISFCEPKRL